MLIMKGSAEYLVRCGTNLILASACDKELKGKMENVNYKSCLRDAFNCAWTFVYSLTIHMLRFNFLPVISSKKSRMFEYWLTKRESKVLDLYFLKI